MGLVQTCPHLSDGAAGNWHFIKVLKDLADRPSKGSLDRLNAEPGAVGRGVGVEPLQGLTQVRREHVRAGCGPLTPLDESRSGLLQSPAHQAHPALTLEPQLYAEWREKHDWREQSAQVECPHEGPGLTGKHSQLGLGWLFHQRSRGRLPAGVWLS
eukprot:scaffold336725_cov32-Prasinocladus_malaysianus.AAC.1